MDGRAGRGARHVGTAALGVQTCATIALRGDDDSEWALERWMEPFGEDATKAEHLLTIGIDRVHVTQALRFLRRHKEPQDSGLGEIMSRVVEIFERHHEPVANAIKGLSTLRVAFRDQAGPTRS